MDIRLHQSPVKGMQPVQHLQLGGERRQPTAEYQTPGKDEPTPMPS
jgi:hypothetical protein